MIEQIIEKNEANQRFDKYLKKLLPEASPSFIYKMLRKKNITLNRGKATGKEIIEATHSVQLYFAEETYAKFHGVSKAGELEQYPNKKLDILYENDDIIIINKPSGMLSQKAKPEELSANEFLIGYLYHSGQISPRTYETFKPSVCNRLDRNTSGLLIFGKSLKGLQECSAALRARTIKKYYLAVVSGRLDQSMSLSGYLYKDEKTNKVTITPTQVQDSRAIETAYQPLEITPNYTVILVHLITGRTHQIRAHLASIGHPIIGDPKYGSLSTNHKFNQSRQLLHAYKMIFPDGRIFCAPPPKTFEIYYKEINEHEIIPN